MCYAVGSVFFRYPAQYLAASVIIEVGIDIGEGDTVGVQETFEQQVVLDRVDLGDPQAVGHSRTGSRTTSGTYRYAQFFAGCFNKVLHNKEVSGEPHCLHNVQLEIQTFPDFFRQIFAIAFSGSVVGQFLQIVGFQLDTVEFVVSAQLLDLIFGIFFAQDDFAVLVACKLFEQILFGQLGAVGFFGSEFFRYGKCRHDRTAVDGVEVYFVGYLKRIAEYFGNIGKDGVHLGGRFHPFLFGIAHTGRVVEVFAGTEADQAVVCLGIFLVDEMHIVGGDQLDIVFVSQFDQDLVHFLLFGIRGAVGIRIVCLVPLHFQVIVFAEQVLEPEDRFFRLVYPVMHDMLWNLTSETGGTDDQVFVIFFQQFVVDTRTAIEAFGP